MADEIVFTAEARKDKGQGPNRRSRLEGRVPGIIYGGKQDPELIYVQAPEVIKALSSGKMMSRVAQVSLGGKQTRVVPREVQLDPVRDKPIHVDFMRLVPGSRVKMLIPVEFKRGDVSPGLKRGGVLNVVRHEVELIVDADNVPDHLEVDLSELDINDSVHINAVTMPAGAKPSIARNFTVATIVPPSTFTTTTPEEEAAAAAPGAEGAEGAAAAPAAEGEAAKEGDKKEAAGAKAAPAKAAPAKGGKEK